MSLSLLRFSVLPLVATMLLSVSLRAQTFTDATQLLQPASPPPGRPFLRSATAADFNNDGLVDLYHPNFREKGRLYLNRGDGGFVDILDDIALNEGANMWGAVFGDYDNDGYLDILFEDLSAPSKLYRNNRNQTFTETNAPAGVAVRTLAQGAAWADFNLDGHLDFLIVNDAGPNQLFKNLGDETFMDISSSANVETFGNSYGIAWGDINADGYPDAFITTCHRTDPLRSIKHLLLNNRDETFTDINISAGVADSLASWGPIFIDYDNDSDLDVYIGNSQHPPRTAYNRLYRNNGDMTFSNAAFEAAVAGDFDESSYAVSPADFDNDGWIDLYVANLDRVDRLYRNNGDGTFTDIAAQAGITLNAHRAVAVADLNNDGWIDIFSAGSPENRLMLNDGGVNHWITISARGTDSNYYGVGTRIELYTGALRQIREINAGDSFCAQNHNLTAHFGLGEHTQIDSVMLKWPSGLVDRWFDIEQVDRYVTMVEGAGLDSPPTTFRLQTPADDDTLQSAQAVTFEWAPASDNESQTLRYNLYVTGTDIFTAVSFDTTIQGIEGSSFTLDRTVIRENHSFRWSMDVTDGLLSRASMDAWRFTVAPIANRFRLEKTELLAADPAPSFGGSWGDLNQDGAPDLFVVNAGNQKNALYQGNGDGTFTKITAGVLVNEEATSVGSTLGDFNQDGRLDVFVANASNQANSLYLNQGGGAFTKLTDAGFGSDTGNSNACAWGDYNSDGFLDLCVANTGTQKNFLYLNNQDRTFTKVTEGAVANDENNSFGCAWADYDGDGHLDLFVANAGNQNNALYRNNGDGTFTKITEGPVVNDGGNSRGGSWYDYDNDGDQDLFVTNFGNNFLYANNGDGTFERITNGPAVTDGGDSRSAVWGDFDLDGDPDLYVTNVVNNALYINLGDGNFAQLADGDLVNDNSASIGAAGADFDEDGDLDIFVATLGTDQGNFLFNNRLAAKNWLSIRLEGRASNTSAIGAKVRLKAHIDGREVWQMREISGQTGFASQNSLRVVFGLGSSTIADSLIIEWPSGKVRNQGELVANQYIPIIEDSTATSVEAPDNLIPRQFGLEQNYPNPFNPATSIRYEIPVTSEVRIRIFNLLGEFVRTLLDSEKGPGSYSVLWDGQDENGRPVASGIYFYRLRTSDFSQTRRMILMR